MNEFEQVQSTRDRPGVTGWWETVIPELSEQQRTDLFAAGAHRGISHQTIRVVLGQWGFEVSASQVGPWRRTHVR